MIVCMTTRPTPAQFVQQFHDARASAILRTNDQQTAAHAMEAAARAGFTIVEFTLTTPGAFELIAEFSRRDDLTVGAGTVLTLEDAEHAYEAGAAFLVSPVLNVAIIDAAKAMHVAMMPGCFTATEFLHAHHAGASLQKLFPMAGTGPKYVKSLLAPLPMLRIVPTNGVHANNAESLLKAGAHAVGFTTALFDANDLRDKRFDAVEQRGVKLLEAVGKRPAATSVV